MLAQLGSVSSSLKWRERGVDSEAVGLGYVTSVRLPGPEFVTQRFED